MLRLCQILRYPWKIHLLSISPRERIANKLALSIPRVTQSAEEVASSTNRLLEMTRITTAALRSDVKASGRGIKYIMSD